MVYVRLKMLLYGVDRFEAQHTTSGDAKVSKGYNRLFYATNIQMFPVSVTAFDVTVWGTGQTFSHSSGLGAPKWDHAHPVTLRIYYRIIQHMKSTLVTLLSITHLSLGLPLPLSSFFLLL